MVASQKSIKRSMRLSNGIFAMAAAVVMAAGMTTSALAVGMVNVIPSNLQGWEDGSGSGGSVSFVNDAPAGFGASSLEFDTPTDGAYATYYGPYGEEQDVPLSEVTDLGYFTKQVSGSSEASASYFIGLDLDADGDFDTYLMHEPYWQNDGSPDAQPVVADEWQYWNVANGKFWSTANYNSPGEGLDLEAGAGGPPLYDLDQIKTAFPNAVVQYFGINTGTNNAGFIIRVDGVSFNGTTYNFENKSVVTAKDECKKGGWESLADASGASFKNQGQCVASVVSSDNSRHNR